MSAMIQANPVKELTAFTLSITGSTSDPTFGTQGSDRAWYRVIGKTLQIYFTRTYTNNTGAAAGSGTYLFSLPSGFTADTTIVATGGAGRGVVGSCSVSGSDNYSGTAAMWDSTHIFLQIGSSNIGSSLGAANTSGGVYYSFHAIVPIV